MVLQRELASMGADDLARDAESQAVARGAAVDFGSKETVEDARSLFRRETSPGVADLEARPLPCPAQLHLNCSSRTIVFHRILQEVAQDLHQPCRIPER